MCYNKVSCVPGMKICGNSYVYDVKMWNSTLLYIRAEQSKLNMFLLIMV